MIQGYHNQPVRTLIGITVSLLALAVGAAGQARGRGTGLGGLPPLAGALPGTGAPGSRTFGRGVFRGGRFAHARTFFGGYAPYGLYPDFVDPYPEGVAQPQVVVIRDEREQAMPPALPVQPKLIELPASSEKPQRQATLPTVLVWRNGQREEVKQYAVIGPFLYDYSKPPTPRRISLNDLDLDATRRTNDERGVQFLIPTSPSEVTIRF